MESLTRDQPSAPGSAGSNRSGPRASGPRSNSSSVGQQQQQLMSNGTNVSGGQASSVGTSQSSVGVKAEGGATASGAEAGTSNV